MTVGMLFGRQIMSPRLTSMSSASRTLTDIGGNASSTGPPNSSTPAIVVRNPLGSTTTSSPGAEDAARHLPRVAAVVVVVVAHRPDDVLHREADVDQVAVTADVDVLEVVQQRRALVPRGVRRVVGDVVAVQAPTPG